MFVACNPNSISSLAAFKDSGTLSQHSWRTHSLLVILFWKENSNGIILIFPKFRVGKECSTYIKKKTKVFLYKYISDKILANKYKINASLSSLQDNDFFFFLNHYNALFLKKNIHYLPIIFRTYQIILNTEDRHWSVPPLSLIHSICIHSICFGQCQGLLILFFVNL